MNPSRCQILFGYTPPDDHVGIWRMPNTTSVAVVIPKPDDSWLLFFSLLSIVVDTAVDGGRHGGAGSGRLVLQAARNNGSSYGTETGSPTPPRQHIQQQQQQQQPPTTPAEPPRTLLRGILSQQPSVTAGGSSTSSNAGAAVLGLVNLHSILQPGHPALRPAGPSDQAYHHLHHQQQQQQQLRHPSLVQAHHPHVKPGNETAELVTCKMTNWGAHPGCGSNWPPWERVRSITDPPGRPVGHTWGQFFDKQGSPPSAKTTLRESGHLLSHARGPKLDTNTSSRVCLFWQILSLSLLGRREMGGRKVIHDQLSCDDDESLSRVDSWEIDRK